MLRKILTLVLSIAILTTATGVFAHSGRDATSENLNNSGSLIDDLNSNLKKQEELRNKIAGA